MQSLTLTGNLGSDAEKKNVNGKTVFEFSVAANDKRRGEEVTTWYRVTLWGDFWEGVSKFLVKGTKVLVVGDYSFRTYESNGKSGVSHEVNGQKLELIGGKADTSFDHGAYERPKASSGNPFEK
jgi:single-strand DNA-binding protein